MWDQPLEEAAKQTLTRTLRDMPQLAQFKVPPIHRINGKQQRPTSHFVRRIKSSNSSISLFTNHRSLWKHKNSFPPHKNAHGPLETTNDP